MYAMCTGRPPFRAETSYGILRRITDTEPRPIREINPDIPEWLVAIVSKLHAKDPGERFHSADRVAKVLEQCLAHVQQPTTVPLPKSLSESDTTTRRRWPRVAAWVGSISAACLVLLAAIVLSMGDPSADEERNVKPPQPAQSLPETPVPPTQDALSPSTVWSDGAERQILELEHDSARLEQQADQLWNDFDSSVTPDLQAEAIER